MIKRLYQIFIQWAEGLNPQSHYHIRQDALVPIPIKADPKPPYYQKYHS